MPRGGASPNSGPKKGTIGNQKNQRNQNGSRNKEIEAFTDQVKS